ncbi:MAG: pre-peptidase C-terminal domain-containing protein [Myxococcota bacterium]|nr:pre-peptidase C-terminal domain-containing protein [Myxococcota bacterium]
MRFWTCFFAGVGLPSLVLAAPQPTLELGAEISGNLGPKDQQLADGEYADFYEFEVNSGTSYRIEMHSEGSNLDPYLALIHPDGTQIDNEDWQESDRTARIDWTPHHPGPWTLIATTDINAMYGPYSLMLSLSDSQNSTSAGAPTAGSEPQMEEWKGQLGKGDSTLSTGEFVDTLEIKGTKGEEWTLDLRSTDFDPYLGLQMPSGETLANDDFEGARDRSLLRFQLQESGDYQIQITSYQAKENGSYVLTLHRNMEAPDSSDAASSAAEHFFTGVLSEGDDTLDGGEWYEVHTFEGRPGQQIRAEMRGDFDTYLILTGPDDFDVQNDDGPEGQNHSVLETVLPEQGTYTFVATSYEANQGGSYTLTTTGGDGPLQSSEQRDVTRIQSGEIAQGTLQSGDMSLQAGEHVDFFALEVEPGMLLQISLESTDFDPYLMLELPDGGNDSNDDWDGSRTLSRIEIPVNQEGQVRIGATSYRPGESGNYTLKAVLTPYEPPETPEATASSASDIYGIFVGISNYAGGVDDLDMTADDAEKLHEGLRGIGMREENSRLLIDHQATQANLIAVTEELGSKMGEEDLLVFFYSGHGNRIARETFQREDADNIDETLTLYDGEYTDDSLDSLLSQHTRGKVLVVLDACFSGGFAKDVISQSGRMGLFSSQEDATSAVAEKFRAGGYLSKFFLEAVSEKRADVDRNREITALELSQYIYERYRTEVQETSQGALKSEDPLEDYVKASENLSFQQLVVDRSGVTPSTVLFSW